MSVRRVGTETGVDPETQAVAELPANFRDGLLRGVVRKATLFLVRRHGKQQELGHPIRQILFDLLQHRRDIMAEIAAQARDRLWLRQALNHKERLDQLGASEFSLGTEVAQMF